VWSGVLTTRLAAFVPECHRSTALSLIKALHTVIFASVGSAIGLFVWDGLRRRPGRRAAIALGIVLTESAVYASNNQVCPLTPLAEKLGAERGSVADIFLPDWRSLGAYRCWAAVRWCLVWCSTSALGLAGFQQLAGLSLLPFRPEE
jgi:hypothetical protein